MVDKIPMQKEITHELAKESVFANGVKWVKLNPTNAVKDPTVGSNARAPTVPEG